MNTVVDTGRGGVVGERPGQVAGDAAAALGREDADADDLGDLAARVVAAAADRAELGVERAVEDRPAGRQDRRQVVEVRVGSATFASRSATDAGPVRVSSWSKPTWIAARTSGEVGVVRPEAAYVDRALPLDRVAVEDEQRVVLDRERRPRPRPAAATACCRATHSIDSGTPSSPQPGQHRRHLVRR